jgi:hypothetical protein
MQKGGARVWSKIALQTTKEMGVRRGRLEGACAALLDLCAISSVRAGIKHLPMLHPCAHADVLEAFLRSSDSARHFIYKAKAIRV